MGCEKKIGFKYGFGFGASVNERMEFLFTEMKQCQGASRGKIKHSVLHIFKFKTPIRHPRGDAACVAWVSSLELRDEENAVHIYMANKVVKSNEIIKYMRSNRG